MDESMVRSLFDSGGFVKVNAFMSSVLEHITFII